MEPRTIFFFGKPGSGKGDQAKLLSEHTGWPVKSSGSLYRRLAAEQTPLARKVKAEMEAGLLMPHWFAMHMFLSELFALKADDNVIFDGFCRKVPEAELNIEALRWIGRPFTVIHLVVSDEELKKRIALRKEIEGRADDVVVDERLKEYREYSEPVLEVSRKAGVLIDVDGERTREAIAEDVRKVLGL